MSTSYSLMIVFSSQNMLNYWRTHGSPSLSMWSTIARRERLFIYYVENDVLFSIILPLASFFQFSSYPFERPGFTPNISTVWIGCRV